MLLLLQSSKSSRSLKLVEQLQSKSKTPMPQTKILKQKVSTKSENKATQKPKCTRRKAGTRIRKAIQQRSHSSQTLNKGSYTDKDKNRRNQNLNHTCVNIVETRHRQGFNCPATMYQCKKCQKYGHFNSKCLTKAQNTNVNTVEEVNAILEFSESPHHVQAELSNNDSFDVMYICTVNASKPRRHVLANLQLATQSQNQNTSRLD